VPDWQGRTIAQLDLRKRYGVSVIAVRSNEKVSAPQPQASLPPGARLVVAGSRPDLSRMRAEAAGRSPAPMP
jgi:trk system potassium uptake protein TrkA